MISLIITSYNYASYVERAIRSALDQSLDNSKYEIIIVNDASTDRTEAVLENYLEECRVFNLKENVGLAAARNFGIRKSKGQFVMFLDADDYIHRDLLYITKLHLEENNQLDAVCTDYWLVDERGNHIKHMSSKEEPIACGILFRKDFLFNIGLYDEEFRAREEEDLSIRWKKKYGVHRIVLPLYRYRMHSNNLTKDEEAMDFGADLLKSKHQQ